MYRGVYSGEYRWIPDHSGIQTILNTINYLAGILAGAGGFEARVQTYLKPLIMLCGARSKYNYVIQECGQRRHLRIDAEITYPQF